MYDSSSGQTILSRVAQAWCSWQRTATTVSVAGPAFCRPLRTCSGHRRGACRCRPRCQCRGNFVFIYVAQDFSMKMMLLAAMFLKCNDYLITIFVVNK